MPTTHEYTITAEGLSVQDRLVVRSTLRLLKRENQKWLYVNDEASADVVLVLSARLSDRDSLAGPAERGRPLWIAVAPAVSAPQSDDLGIALPLRARELIPQLASLSAKLAEHRERRSSVATAYSMTWDSARVLNALTNAWEPAERSRMKLRIGRGVVLSLECDSKRSIQQGLRWRARGVSSLLALCTQVARGESLQLEADANVAIPTLEPTCHGTFSQLVWAITAYEPQPQPAMAMDAQTKFSLKYWPDFGSLPSTPSQLHIAAVLARKQLTQSELIAVANIDLPQVTAVLNACYWMKILSIEVTRETPASPRPFVSDVVMARPAEGLGALMRSIRSALRSAGARTRQ